MLTTFILKIAVRRGFFCVKKERTRNFFQTAAAAFQGFQNMDIRCHTFHPLFTHTQFKGFNSAILAIHFMILSINIQLIPEYLQYNYLQRCQMWVIKKASLCNFSFNVMTYLSKYYANIVKKIFNDSL